jgi:hypothetical protein
MRTLARARRLRRNGSGPEGEGGASDVVGEPAPEASVEVDGGWDDCTAGKPIIVFLRGGLDGEGPPGAFD